MRDVKLLLSKDIEHGQRELNFIHLCLHPLCDVLTTRMFYLIEEEKGFILILEIFFSLGSGVGLFLFHHLTETEARWKTNMELDADILHIWFGPTARSKLPPGASYPKLIYFLFS